MDFGFPWPINLDICPIFFIGDYGNKICRKKLFSDIPLPKLGRLMVYNTIIVAIKFDTAWIKLSIYCRITIWLGHVKKNYFRYAMLLAKYEYYCKVI